MLSCSRTARHLDLLCGAQERTWLPQPPSGPTSGQLSLMGVALLWGTYAPALRCPPPPRSAALVATTHLMLPAGWCWPVLSGYT